jgi:hypothetical protein
MTTLGKNHTYVPGPLSLCLGFLVCVTVFTTFTVLVFLGVLFLPDGVLDFRLSSKVLFLLYISKVSRRERLHVSIDLKVFLFDKIPPSPFVNSAVQNGFQPHPRETALSQTFC